MTLGPNHGAPLEQYIVDATDTGAGNDKWTSTTVQSYIVPTGFAWWLIGGHVNRDTQTGTATLLVQIFNGANKLVLQLDTQTNATGTTPYPNSTSTGAINFPFFMEAGWYVKVTVGEAQGALATASCYVMQVPAVP